MNFFIMLLLEFITMLNEIRLGVVSNKTNKIMENLQRKVTVIDDKIESIELYVKKKFPIIMVKIICL